MFRGIASKSFPPFGEFRLLLPPVPDKPADLAEVHLLTGVNGTGKTRLLAVMAAMLGHHDPLCSRLRDTDKPTNFQLSSVPHPPSNLSGSEWALHFDGRKGGVGRSGVGALNQWILECPAFAYSGVPYVSDAPISVMADMPKPNRADCLSFDRPEAQSRELLQAISNLKVQAAMDVMNGSQRDAPPSHAGQIARAMEGAIAQIAGMPFSFQITSYPKAALEVSWAGSKLPVDLLPDGLRSIIGWLVHALVMTDAWLQGEGTPMETEAVFLLDEIESHLHPAWQRRILPAFQRLFPKSQIIIATHSPFVISSLNHGWIHPITLQDDGRAVIQEPVKASEGDSYVSVLEDVMGVKEWYDTETEDLLRRFREQREAAYGGNSEARTKAETLAETISHRSQELGFMMGRELSQMERQLAAVPAAE